jgi:hypothetical protein
MDVSHGATMSATGKWKQAGVPHKGWTCVGIKDLGVPCHRCEMCEVMDVRYVHTMEHPDYETLDVGCICAGHMEQDLVGARKRETDFKRSLTKRRRWVSSGGWRVSTKGNNYINTDGFNIVTYPNGRGWGARIKHRWETRMPTQNVRGPTEEAARLAAWEMLQKMKRAYAAYVAAQTDDDCCEDLT